MRRGALTASRYKEAAPETHPGSGAAQQETCLRSGYTQSSGVFVTQCPTERPTPGPVGFQCFLASLLLIMLSDFLRDVHLGSDVSRVLYTVCLIVAFLSGGATENDAADEKGGDQRGHERKPYPIACGVDSDEHDRPSDDGVLDSSSLGVPRPIRYPVGVCSHLRVVQE